MSANQFTDSEGEIFLADPDSHNGQRTIVLTVAPSGIEASTIEFFASDAERIIELIREAQR